MTSSLDYLDSVSDCKNYGHLIDFFELKHLKKHEGKQLSQFDFSRVDCLVGFSMVHHVVDLVADGTREQNTCCFFCHFFKALFEPLT